ncbi:MAG: hypothetical protein MUF87_16580 [Anaerolineae bacterium]|jgi:hypothetical protein|nr:hypothetical protein [Anaerolineae bacterium]
MPYTIYWLQEQRVICCQYHQQVSLDELRETDHLTHEKLTQNGPNTHLILDASDLKKFPLDVGAITKSVSFYRNANLGYCLLITNSNIVNLLGATITHVIGKRLMIVRSREEAILKLQQLDSTVRLLELK